MKSKQTAKGLFHPKTQRYFSEELKRKLVSDIENKRLKVRDVVNLYKVTDTSVYKWLSKYSSFKCTGARMIIEQDSHETKIDQMMKRIMELERNVGKKQLEIEFLNKALDLCSSELGYDVKKKYSTMLLNGTE